jgi:hypothetical protein
MLSHHHFLPVADGRRTIQRRPKHVTKAGLSFIELILTLSADETAAIDNKVASVVEVNEVL